MEENHNSRFPNGAGNDIILDSAMENYSRHVEKFQDLLKNSRITSPKHSEGLAINRSIE
jgi:hypothetical protein